MSNRVSDFLDSTAAGTSKLARVFVIQRTKYREGIMLYRVHRVSPFAQDGYGNSSAAGALNYRDAAAAHRAREGAQQAQSIGLRLLL